MKISNTMRAKMMQWEGCSLTAYRCPAGVLTIGYGHTGPDVTEDKVITPAQAVALFNYDIDKFAAGVEALTGAVALSERQFDALVSFAYNVGIAAFKKSTLLRKVLADPADKSIRGEFMKYVKSRVNGQFRQLPGLVKRRSAEADHYFGL